VLKRRASAYDPGRIMSRTTHARDVSTTRARKTRWSAASSDRRPRAGLRLPTMRQRLATQLRTLAWDDTQKRARVPQTASPA
jgi:hypothetical protein